MSKLICSLLQQYNQKYSTFWFDGLNWDTEEDSAKSYSVLSESMATFADECFIGFSESLIQGEYIVDQYLKDDLEGFKSALYDEHRSDDGNAFKSTLLNELSQLTDSISFVIDSYLHFIINLKERYSFENRHYLFSAISTHGRNRHMNKLLSLFCNEEVFLFQFEHCFSRSDSLVQKLILIRAKLEDIKKDSAGVISQILSILIGKCAFLLTKLLYQDGKSEYLLDFKHYVLPEDVNDKVANFFIDDFKFYYRETYLQSEPHIKDIQARILRGEELGYREFVLLAKYYKDSSYGTRKQFQNLIESFDKKRKRDIVAFGTKNYDVYALRILTNYMYNCQLSFVLKNEKPDYENVKKEYDRILSIQNETCVYNFYPHRKIIQYLINEIRSFIHSDAFSDVKIGDRLSFLRNTIDSYEKSLNWCEEISFFPVVNIYNDCFLFDDNLKIKVYYPSSFSSYVDYNERRKELNDFEAEYRLIKTEKTLQVENENLSKIKDAVEDNKNRLVEIFGLFTTVVALIFGGISIFTNGETPGIQESLPFDVYHQYSESLLKQKLINYLGFGFSLLLFDAFLLLLLKNDRTKDGIVNKGKTWITLGMIIVSFVVVLECLFRSV